MNVSNIGAIRSQLNTQHSYGPSSSGNSSQWGLLAGGHGFLRFQMVEFAPIF